ncbi:larval cuticle protein A1A-like [Oratosquilla oratoria]|uniref:larval cuticle protein A1A-like n=1 Tax=Oratosquilla oratoria TaxID=337810 RepID=UPI003F762097
MKIVTLLFLVCVALTGAAPQGAAEPERLYDFGYEVQDEATNNFQNRAEIKTVLGDVFGSYSLLMPNGFIYTTTYTVTGKEGFKAKLVITDPDTGNVIDQNRYPS